MIWRMWYIIPRVLGCTSLKFQHTCRFCRGKGSIVEHGDYASNPPGWEDFHFNNDFPHLYFKGGKFGRRVRTMCFICQGTGFVDWVTNIKAGEEHPNARIRRWPLEYMEDVIIVLDACRKAWRDELKKKYAKYVTKASKKR